jgi:hypothetical protein
VRRAALVSVQGTAAYWRRQGFEALACAPADLAGYGEGALYMGCDVPQGGVAAAPR